MDSNRKVLLKTFSWRFLEPLPGWFGFLFTEFALVGLTNGFNMSDGVDGLASGYMLTGLLLVAATTLSVTGALPSA